MKNVIPLALGLLENPAVAPEAAAVAFVVGHNAATRVASTNSALAALPAGRLMDRLGIGRATLVGSSYGGANR